MQTTAEIVSAAARAGIAVPAFNVPYLPMVEPVVRAARDTDSFALVATARVEWVKFESRGLGPVMDEFLKWDDPAHVRLHLDHVPAIDEDNLSVDYLAVIREAIALGYQSLMIDASRLDLAGNIQASKSVAELAHAAGIACEAELGAVLGHEAGPLPPYEELFTSGLGFTDVDEARSFVQETGCDWLSVAVGSIHGAVSAASRDKKKVAARIDIPHLQKLSTATGIPLVLHGGSGVQQEYVLEALTKGITKVNVGTEIRQAYDFALRDTDSVVAAQDAVYERTSQLITDYFHIGGTRAQVMAD